MPAAAAMAVLVLRDGPTGDPRHGDIEASSNEENNVFIMEQWWATNWLDLDDDCLTRY